MGSPLLSGYGPCPAAFTPSHSTLIIIKILLSISVILITLLIAMRLRIPNFLIMVTIDMCWKIHGVPAEELERRKARDRDRAKDSIPPVSINVMSTKDKLTACFYSGSRTHRWMLDSGCTDHISPHKQDFDTIKPDPLARTVRLGDNSSILCQGIGSIKASAKRTNGITKLTLCNVLYVPKASHRFLSISKLDELGFTITHKAGTCTILRDNQILCSGFLE